MSDTITCVGGSWDGHAIGHIGQTSYRLPVRNAPEDPAPVFDIEARTHEIYTVRKIIWPDGEVAFAALETWSDRQALTHALKSHAQGDT